MQVIDIDEYTPVPAQFARTAPVVSARTTRPISRCGGTNTTAGARPLSGPTLVTERRLGPMFPRRDPNSHGQRSEHRLRL